ncbi:hypothetical protein F5Y16DRAFT_315425 [Xylariaceae sp. FL0255]|nr:hypothetical protein F5Y16DRAFT_315425 [Xylariaceae sp. FL0255]
MRFLFGRNKELQTSDAVKSYLENLVDGRQYDLVTYDGESTTCKVLEELHLNAPRHLYHLNVRKAAKWPLQEFFRSATLLRVLNALNLPHRNLHVAGNDARFTTHAMLMLVVYEWNFAK